MALCLTPRMRFYIKNSICLLSPHLYQLLFIQTYIYSISADGSTLSLMMPLSFRCLGRCMPSHSAAILQNNIKDWDFRIADGAGASVTDRISQLKEVSPVSTRELLQNRKSVHHVALDVGRVLDLNRAAQFGIPLRLHSFLRWWRQLKQCGARHYWDA